MPGKKILVKAKKAKREGKKSATQISEFVREEMYHIQNEKRKPVSKKKAGTAGLSQNRGAGIDGAPASRNKSPRTPRHRSAATYQTADVHPYRDYYTDRSQAILRLLEKEDRQPEIPDELFSQYGQEPSRFSNYF